MTTIFGTDRYCEGREDGGGLDEKEGGGGAAFGRTAGLSLRRNTHLDVDVLPRGADGCAVLRGLGNRAGGGGTELRWRVRRTEGAAECVGLLRVGR